MSTNLNNLIITNQNYSNTITSSKSNLGSTKNSKNNPTQKSSLDNKINFNDSYTSLNKDFPGFSIPSDNEFPLKEKEKEINYENLNENDEEDCSKIFEERKKILTNNKNYKSTYRGSKGKFDFENLSVQNTSKEILKTEGSYEGKFTDNLLNKIMENPFVINNNKMKFQEDSCEKDLEKKMESVFQKCGKGNKYSNYSKASSKGNESKFSLIFIFKLILFNLIQ